MNMVPPPVPLDRLKGLLDKSKFNAVMKKAEIIAPRGLMTETSDVDYEDPEEYYSPPVVDYATTVNNSKLPDAIKKLMLDKPISRPDQIQMVSVTENYSEDDEKPMPEMSRKGRPAPAAPQQRQRITEDLVPKGGMITISEAQLEKMINDKLLAFFKASYDKALTEAAINRTIKTMISEGVITAKKK